MFEQLLKYNRPSYLFGIHLAIGIGCLFSSWVLISWIYFIVFTNVNRIFKTRNPFQAIALITYILSFEVFARMVFTSPYIPYEISKYVLVFGLAFFILRGRFDNNIGWLMLVLILPGLLYDESDSATFQNIVFNSFGPIAISLAIIYFKAVTITFDQLISLLRLILLPLSACLIYVYFRTPDYDEINFNLSANFDTTGGFGSNQVSTILGLGGLLSLIFIIFRWPLTGYRIADVALFFLFSFQGLLTFSRGGMIGMGLGILVLVYMLTKSGIIVKSKYRIPDFASYLFPLIFIGTFAFQIADSITGGNLSLRYQGETYGTTVGAREKDLNVITTNRYNIFLEDVALFTEYGWLGVGVGASKYLREGEVDEGTAAHVELSRLIAEHGIFGIGYFILLVLLYYLYIQPIRHPVHKALAAALFVLALYTTFHAATRTFVTPLLIGLSMLNVQFREDETPAPVSGK
jgi:hypothetical protein